ncbi:hypothetical protein ACFSQJ_16785 [Croceitalea marina]|uniref:Uncharacterized protein n=1 Tax=Croceitalea marina TaxID=1775166 RepID=A0ABW5MYX9_9FLAO
MDFNPENTGQMLSGAIENGLYDELVQQLRKDFEHVNIAFLIGTDVDSGALETTLKEKIYVLLLEDFEGYLNLMYSIDVPEASFATIKPTDAVDVSEQVVFLVLKRIYQKVYFKRIYSKKS